MFGSGNHLKQPTSIIQGFVQRSDANRIHPSAPTLGLMPGKTIARASRIRSLDVHTCNLSWGQRILPSGYRTSRSGFQPISEERLEQDLVHINHYAIQSEDLFRKVKMTRGDVNSSEYTQARDMSYFKRYDINQIHDQELAEKRG